jgi:hypothetical protein
MDQKGSKAMILQSCMKPELFDQVIEGSEIHSNRPGSCCAKVLLIEASVPRADIIYYDISMWCPYTAY